MRDRIRTVKYVYLNFLLAHYYLVKHGEGIPLWNQSWQFTFLL